MHFQRRNQEFQKVGIRWWYQVTERQLWLFSAKQIYATLGNEGEKSRHLAGTHMTSHKKGRGHNSASLPLVNCAPVFLESRNQSTINNLVILLTHSKLWGILWSENAKSNNDNKDGNKIKKSKTKTKEKKTRKKRQSWLKLLRTMWILSYSFFLTNLNPLTNHIKNGKRA